MRSNATRNLHLKEACSNPTSDKEKSRHMDQKIAFITGGNRGLGFQTALDFKDQGVKVVIGSRDAKLGEEAVERLRAAGLDADVIPFDITKEADHQSAYEYFNSKYGRLDILVNNAGI